MRKLLLVTVFLVSAQLSSAQTSQTGLVTNGPAAQRENYGPDPWADARPFGVRSITNSQVPAIPGCTATVKRGSRQATLSSTCGLRNNDGVIAYGGGVPNPISTPTITSVTPSIPESTTGSFATVAGQTGSTTYNYCAAALNPGNGTATNPGTGETACSAVFTITNGQATLGPQSVAISSITCAGSLCTVTTSGNQSLGAYGAFTIGGAIPAVFNGNRNVDTWISATQFTFKAPNSTTIDDAPSVATTPGTLYWNTSNTIKVADAAGSVDGTRYVIYRSGPGLGGVIACVTLPQHSAERSLFWHNVCEDYGPTYSPSPTMPYYVSPTAPSTATNEGLSTFIVSGGGTISVTLNDQAATTISGQTILFDVGVGLVRAGKAQVAFLTGESKVYIPTPTPSQFYIINAPTHLPNASYLYRGGLLLQDTLYPYFDFTADPQGFASFPAFSYSGYTGLICQRAWPCLQTNGGYKLTGFNLSVPESGIGILSHNPALPAVLIDNVYISTGGFGYTTIGHVVQPGGAGSLNYGYFGWNGYQQSYGGMTTPGLLLLGGPAQLTLDRLSNSAKGISLISTSGSGFSLRFLNSQYIQKADGPLLSLLNIGSGTQSGNVYFGDTCNDTGATGSWIAVYGSATGGFNLNLFTGTSSCATGTANLLTVSGNNIVTAWIPGNINSGQNVEHTGTVYPDFNFGTNFLWNGGSLNSARTHSWNFGTDIAVSAAHGVYVKGFMPPAPTCNVQAGGSMTVRTWYAFYVPIMETGNGGTASAYCSFTTTTGNQTVKMNWTPIVGAKGYSVYMAGTLYGQGNRSNPVLITSLPYTFSANSFQGDYYGRPMDGTIGGSNGLWHAQKIAVGRSIFQKFTDTQESAVTVPDIAAYTLAAEIASGTATMTTGDISAGACGNTVTVTAPNTLTTDAVVISSNAAVTTPNGLLIVNYWPTADHVNFRYCNPTASSQTPTANTMNWRVIR